MDEILKSFFPQGMTPEALFNLIEEFRPSLEALLCKVQPSTVSDLSDMLNEQVGGNDRPCITIIANKGQIDILHNLEKGQDGLVEIRRGDDLVDLLDLLLSIMKNAG